MCVRTLVEASTTVIAKVQPQKEEQNQGNKLTKAKEKYMKLHDEMLAKEAEILKKESLKKREQLHKMMVANDLLAKSTFYYSLFISSLSKYHAAWQNSKAYKILFYTTQPAHVIMIAAVLCVTTALVPYNQRKNPAGHPHSTTASFIYLTSFVIHFGSQIWMTFVSGLSLYFALPRHTFGEVQRILFPRYFTLNALLSLITLLIFVKHHPANSWDTAVVIQIAGMLGAFFIELFIRLYLTPPLLCLITKKTALERAAGVGAEIGRHNPGALKHCPHYLAIHHAFRRVHMTIAMGNMVTMALTVLHLHYIASKLCVL